MLEVDDSVLHGYSRAAMVPAGAPGAAVVVEVAMLEQEASV